MKNLSGNPTLFSSLNHAELLCNYFTDSLAVMMNRQKSLSQQEIFALLQNMDSSGIQTLEEALLRIRQQKGQMDGARGYSSSVYSVRSPLSSPNSTTTQFVRKKGKTYEEGRRNLKEEPVSKAEADRRARRRERNRLAAARCRGKRQHVIDSLQDSVSSLKEDSRKLHENLRRLAREKDRLSRVLQSHDCALVEDNVEEMEIVNLKREIQDSVSEQQYENMPPQEPLTVPTPPLLTPRPSSLPLPPPVSRGSGPQEVTASSLTRISPLLTPSTISFLDHHPSTQDPNGLFTSAGSYPTHSHASLSYLNLLSPTLELANLNFLSSPTSNPEVQHVFDPHQE